METIKTINIDHSKSKIIDEGFIELKLMDEILHYSCYCVCEEEIENDKFGTSTIQEKTIDANIILQKKDISGVTMTYNTINDRWTVATEVKGLPDSIDVYYHERYHAKQTAEKIIYWWLGIDVNLK